MKAKHILNIGVIAVLLALVYAVFMPCGSRCRCAAPVKVDLNNLRQISVGLATYAYETEGVYPDSLSEAFNQKDGIFREGSYQDIIFSDSRNTKKEVSITEIDETTDWIYIRGHTTASPSDLIVLFSPAGKWKKFNEGEMLVATVGGTALIMKDEEFVRSMNQTMSYLQSSSTKGANQAREATP